MSAPHNPDYPYPGNCTTDEQHRVWDEYVASWLSVGLTLDLVEGIFRDEPEEG